MLQGSCNGMHMYTHHSWLARLLPASFALPSACFDPSSLGKAQRNEVLPSRAVYEGTGEFLHDSMSARSFQEELFLDR